MSLRVKILLLFAALAVAPILAVGVVDYMHSIHALDQLVRTKVEGTTEQAAREIGERYAQALADARRIAEQPAAGRLLRAAANGEPWQTGPDRLLVDELHRESWPELRERFASIELVDPWGRLVYRFADPGASPAAPLLCGEPAAISTVTWPVFDAAGRAGQVVAVPRLEALLPFELLEPRFGSGGLSLVVNRETQRVVYSQDCAHVGRTAEPVLAALGLDDRAGWLRESRGRLAGSEDGDLFASYVSVGTPPWTVARSAHLDEFTTPYARMRLGYLFFVLFVAIGAGGAFSILLSGVMRSLRQLGAAADRIGGGDFNPWLPPPTRDEVGHLSMAIALMVDKLRQSLRQIEISRQMAVVGKMAAYLAHEVRNPLSSIRLNLQSLVRESRDGERPEDLPEVLELCLGEVKRLDTAVHSVLTLGRAQQGAKRPVAVHDILDDTLDLLEPQFARKHIRVETGRLAEQDRVEANPEQIKGVLLNLLLNAAAAMPDGGRITIGSEVVDRGEAGPALALHVRDEGLGVPDELKERIFEPFFTTKRSGTGIGLSLSMQTAQEHGGRLFLAETAGQAGAEFVLELPLLQAQEPTVSEGGDTLGSADEGVGETGIEDAGAPLEEVEVAAGAAAGNGGDSPGPGRKGRKDPAHAGAVRESA